MRRPLVYSTKAARDQAERLLGGRVLENAVEEAIVAGCCVSGASGGLVFDPERRWIARARFSHGHAQSHRRAWVIHEVRPHKRERRQGHVTALQ